MTQTENNLQEENSPLDINTDENVSGFSHLSDNIEEESELAKLEEALATEKDRYLRLAAEFDNFKRRNAKERIELMQTAGKEVIIDLLDVIDDSERASKQIETSENIVQIKEGVSLVFAKLKNKLQSRGLKAMEAMGEVFDSSLHEAITEIPAPSEDLKEKVVDEVMKGYYLNDKIIRHAKVVVGK